VPDGVVLILVTLTANLFRAGPAFERVTNNFRPEMKAGQLAQLRQDVNGLAAVQAEFTTNAIPQLAAALKTTPQQLSASLGQQYPAVVAGLQNVPRATEQFNGVLNVLGAERARFADADAIPTGSLPVTTVPWGLAGAGLLCIAVAFILPRRRGAGSAVALGVLLVAASLLLSLPGKADAADTMNSHLKPVYTAELVNGARQSLDLAGNFPAVTAGLTSMPAALGRFDQLVKTFDSSLADYNTAKETTLVPIVWILLAAGLLVAGIGGWVLMEGHAVAVVVRRERAPLRHALAGHGRERLGH
jgi:hypothetical protein